MKYAVKSFGEVCKENSDLIVAFVDCFNDRLKKAYLRVRCRQGLITSKLRVFIDLLSKCGRKRLQNTPSIPLDSAHVSEWVINLFLLIVVDFLLV